MSSLDDACVAAMCENLSLETLQIEENSQATAGVIDIILASQTAQTLSDLALCWIDGLTSADVLRLVRGCPKLTDLLWYARGLTPHADDNARNVDDLTELLESRAAQSSEDTYFELDVFPECGPWKRDSHHYRNTRMSQHPPGPQW